MKRKSCKLYWKPCPVLIHPSIPANTTVQLKLHGATRKGYSQSKRRCSSDPCCSEAKQWWVWGHFLKASMQWEKTSGAEKQTKKHIVMQNCLFTLPFIEAEVEPHHSLALFIQVKTTNSSYRLQWLLFWTGTGAEGWSLTHTHNVTHPAPYLFLRTGLQDGTTHLEKEHTVSTSQWRYH